jgi:hypothetical protein
METLSAATRVATPIHREPIRDAAAWTAASLGDDPKARLTRRLKPAELAAMDDLLRRTRERAPWDITARDAAGLAELAGEVRSILAHGTGIVVLQGIDRARTSKEDCERIFWAIGTFLGDSAMQNPRGDLITHVKHDKSVPAGRGYRSTAELSPHTDAYAIFGLMCLERAEKGGFSRATSALTLHNEILASRPELLEPMYRGTRYATSDARGTSVGPTPVNVPIFSCIDRQVSCFYSRQNLTEAARQSGEPLDPAFAAAADHFQALAQDRRFMIEFMLDPGEIMLANNYVLLHARTEFEDSERHTRDLLRLWLDNAPMRPVIPELHLFAKIYKDIFALQRKESR